MGHSRLSHWASQELKAQTRALVRSRLGLLSQQAREDESRELCEILKTLIEAHRFQEVLAFLPDASEPVLAPLLQDCLDKGIGVALPRLAAGNSLDFREVSSLGGPWERHRWGVDQPESSARPWTPRGHSLILVPGVAFAPGGERLGRGGGFYDRFLARRPGLTAWGVALSCQIVESLPREAHDRRLSGLILGGDSGILSRGGHLWD